MAYAYKFALTVAAAQVTGTLTDFTAVFADTCNGTGGEPDLRVVGSGGHIQNSDTGGTPNPRPGDLNVYSDSGLTSAIPFEVQYWSPTTGQIVLWIKVASMAVGSTVYVAYGDAAVTTSPMNAANTWNSNFKYVGHLGDGTTGSGADSTTNANNGTLQNTPTAGSGKVNGSLGFAAASDEYVDLGSGASLGITGSLTLATWVNLASSPADNTAYMLMARDHDTNGRAYVLDVFKFTGVPITGAAARMYINGGGADDSNGNNIIFGSGTALSTSTWYRIMGVYNASGTLDIYVNGTSARTQRTGEATSINSATTNVLLARRGYTGFTNPLDGSLDEPFIISGAMTAAWAEADYNNQNSPTTFWPTGAETSTSATIGHLQLTLLGVS